MSYDKKRGKTVVNVGLCHGDVFLELLAIKPDAKRHVGSDAEAGAVSGEEGLDRSFWTDRETNRLSMAGAKGDAQGSTVRQRLRSRRLRRRRRRSVETKRRRSQLRLQLTKLGRRPRLKMQFIIRIKLPPHGQPNTQIKKRAGIIHAFALPGEHHLVVVELDAVQGLLT
ncbi:hypothetical protein CDD81_3974 [Ophiocordyceps australis]|uniref:Uncharacterized protein n=1 Tax=Ophiocordyceps australis TaxID=1399860 RepID=A0A2C5XU67_9HYPO|nr:hypothetical protein CDD81_3974 [Ophiocordyceps australis]